MWIETPNIGSYGHKHFGCNWRGLEPPRHIVIFNWNALESLMEEIGFCKFQKILNNNYTDIAKKSRALEEGKSPYDERFSAFSDILTSMFMRLWIKINYTKSEFITIVANKPDSEDGADMNTNEL